MKFGSTKIGGMSFGSVRIGGAKFGNTLVFQPGGEPEPGRISCIRGGSDGSYIDTGITPDETTKIIILARNWNPGGASYTWLFGSRVANLDSMFGLSTMNNANLGKIRVCFGNTNTDLSDKWPLMSHYHKYELSSDGLYVDDVLISSVTSSTFSNNYNIHIFGVNNAGARISPVTPIDVCAAKIYKNGALVRDFTAVRNPFIGLYDSISQTVFTNAGSGSFVYKTFYEDAYAPLEYITTSGASYILTDVNGSYGTPIIVKFRSTLSSASWSEIIGSRDSTKRCEIFIGNTSSANANLYAILNNSGSATTIYDSGGASQALKNKDIVLLKNDNQFTAYYNYAQMKTPYSGTSTSSFTTGVPLILGGRNYNGFSQPFYGRLYYAKVSGHNFVPAKVNDVAGMYDTYDDTFYPSSSSTPFTAGTAL